MGVAAAMHDGTGMVLPVLVWLCWVVCCYSHWQIPAWTHW